jgi:GGDEF domain-containing protein
MRDATRSRPRSSRRSDHFKLVNDTFGGRRILSAPAAWRGPARDDVACRYGGEEMVLLPQHDRCRRARRRQPLRAALADKRILSAPKAR